MIRNYIFGRSILRGAALLSLTLGGQRLHAQFVTPQMGGGQQGMMSAPMKHLDISRQGNRLDVQIDHSIDTPVLRALPAELQFDPELSWSVLQGKHYNFQYGWNPGGFIMLPAGSWIWMERVESDEGLEVFQRPPATPAYEPILTADGQRWRWPGSMTHNVYAVHRPQQANYEVTYRVYLGDEDSGEETLDADGQPLFASDLVRLQFEVDLIGDFDGSELLDSPDVDLLSAAVLAGEFAEQFDLNADSVLDAADRDYWVQELVGTVAGDANLDGHVDFADFLALSSSYGTEAGWAGGDFSGDNQVQFADFLMLSQQFGFEAASATGVAGAAVPEPTLHWVWLSVAAFGARRRHRH